MSFGNLFTVRIWRAKWPIIFQIFFNFAPVFFRFFYADIRYFFFSSPVRSLLLLRTFWSARCIEWNICLLNVIILRIFDGSHILFDFDGLIDDDCTVDGDFNGRCLRIYWSLCLFFSILCKVKSNLFGWCLSPLNWWRLRFIDWLLFDFSGYFLDLKFRFFWFW